MPDPRPEIGPGSRVTLHYTVMLETGLVVDSTEGDAPLEFTLGDGTFIQGLELALMGLRAGDTQTLRIGPESAFGFHDPDGIQELTRADFPGDMEPEVGQIIGFTTPAGDEILAAVKEIDGERIVMDFNHPLAGHEITFSVEILDVLSGA